MSSFLRDLCEIVFLQAATTGVAVRHVDPRFSPTARLLGGKATVRHGLVAVRLAQVAVSGAVEVAIAALEQIEFRVSQ